ncbi:MAG: response regulator transcription factor [Clostridium sp.]|nr:response regulator transcription factor [Clostridium sp.]
MENNTILVIDDDKNILAIIEMYLKKEQYNVKTCERGDLALQLFRETQPALVVLDVMLPGMDGWEVLGQLRAESAVPVIMLTAKGDTLDRIQGLDLGADDYIVKPFDAKELLARIKAVLRRSTQAEEDGERLVTFDGLIVSLDNYSVTLDGKQIEMPPKEIELLYFLASREGKVFTREQLLEQVWGFDFFGDSRTVDVHVKRIRGKLGERDAWQIKTVWGVGYKFEAAK